MMDRPRLRSFPWKSVLLSSLALHVAASSVLSWGGGPIFSSGIRCQPSFQSGLLAFSVKFSAKPGSLEANCIEAYVCALLLSSLARLRLRSSSLSSAEPDGVEERGQTRDRVADQGHPPGLCYIFHRGG